MAIPEKLMNLFGGPIPDAAATKTSMKTILIVVLVVGIGIGAAYLITHKNEKKV